MSEKTEKRCGTCKFLKSNKTCKEHPRTPNGDYDWCGAWKKKAGLK